MEQPHACMHEWHGAYERTQVQNQTHPSKWNQGACSSCMTSFVNTAKSHRDNTVVSWAFPHPRAWHCSLIRSMQVYSLGTYQMHANMHFKQKWSIWKKCMQLRHEVILNVLSSNLVSDVTTLLAIRHELNDACDLCSLSSILEPPQILKRHAKRTSWNKTHAWSATCMHPACMTPECLKRNYTRSHKFSSNTMVPCMHLVRGAFAWPPSRKCMHERWRVTQGVFIWRSLRSPLCWSFHIIPILGKQLNSKVMRMHVHGQLSTWVRERFRGFTIVALSQACEACP